MDIGGSNDIACNTARFWHLFRLVACSSFVHLLTEVQTVILVHSTETIIILLRLAEY